MRGFREREICKWLENNGPATARMVGDGIYLKDNRLSVHPYIRKMWAQKKLDNLVKKGYVERMVTLLGTEYALRREKTK